MHNYMAALVKVSGQGNYEKAVCIEQQAPQ
jgi:hypothetical protein